MNNYELIIFDMDGLMFDTERTYCNNIEYFFSKKSIEIDLNPLLEVIGTSLPIDLSRMNLGNIDNKQFEKMLNQSHIESVNYMNKYGVPVKKGLIRLLNYAKSKGIRMCVGTSTPIEISRKYLDNTGVIDYIDFIVTRREVKHGKPFPDIFLKCCEIANVNIKNALVLEDTNNGCLAAKNAGIPYIMVPDIQIVNDDIRKNAVAIVENLEEVIKFI